MNLIRERWMKLTSEHNMDVVLAENSLREIEMAYAESSRHYHTLAHLQALLTFSEEYKNQLKYKPIIDFAIYYHDIVYKASGSDNEAQSARIAEERLSQLKFPEEERKVVVDFILTTKSHTINSSPYENELKWFLDFDLSVLGADEPVYFEYVKNIRKEFKIYPDLLYKPGRRKVLQHFLNMDFIFKTQEFRNRFEKRARVNLQKEFDQLK